MFVISKKRMTFVSAIAVVLLFWAGCSSSSNSNKSTEKITAQPTGCNSDKESSIPTRSSDMNRVQFLAPPIKEGMRLNYISDILAFNFAGDAAVAPVTPKQVWEYRLGESVRAVAVLSELNGDAIVIIFDCSGKEKESFSLNGHDEKAKGWLLRAQSAEPLKQEDIRRFLANPEESSMAFKLKGQVAITLKDGYVQRMSFAKVATIANVPVHDGRLKSQIEFEKHQLDQLTQELKEKPGDELLAWGIKKAKEKLSRLQSLEKTQALSPAKLTDGQIVAEWVRRGPILEIDLP